MNFLTQYWEILLSAVSILGIPISYFLGGKQAKAQELKKGGVEIKVAEVDYASKISDLYEGMMNDIKIDRDKIKDEKETLQTEYKEERDYFRVQIDELRKQSDKMQEQFNTISTSYALEVERSQNWEKLHRELNEKYLSLERDHDTLKRDHDTLKKDFDILKKQTVK